MIAYQASMRPLPSKQQAKRLFERILGMAPKRQVEVALFATCGGLTRFADNAISQNVAGSDMGIMIKLQRASRVGRASTNQTDDRSLRQAVASAEAALSSSRKSDCLPLPRKGTYRKVAANRRTTLAVGPEEREERVATAIRAARRFNCSGIFETGQSLFGIMNSRGLFAYHLATGAGMTLTATTSDGGAGFSACYSQDVSCIDPEALALRAAETAAASRNPRTVHPGRYTVVLAPEAVSELVLFLGYLAFGALPYLEGRSPVAGRLGESLFSPLITIDDDAYHNKGLGVPFDFEGIPRNQVRIVDRGVFSALVQDRVSAQKMNTKTTGHSLPQPNAEGPIPMNLVIREGETSTEEMIASTRKGLYITQFHYTNVLDPARLVLTGMTRNGTFLIRNGKLAHPVKNLRFTESALEAFRNVEAVGDKLVCTEAFFGGTLVLPSLKIPNFRFSSETEF